MCCERVWSLSVIGLNWKVLILAMGAISDSTDLSNANNACAYLVQCLIVPPLLKGTGIQLPGAAGAVFANGKRAVSVEQVSSDCMH